MSSLRLLVPIAGAVLAMGGSAEAATLSLDRECYVDAGAGTQHPIVASAGGLTPNGEYSVSFAPQGGSGDTGYASGLADASGVASLSIGSWSGGSTSTPGTYDATVSLRDSSGTVVATADTKTASLQVDVTGSGALRTWKVSGLAALTGGTTYYAHYFNHNKYKGRLTIGKAGGPCGWFKGKRPLTPFSKLGQYDVKVTTTKKWAKGDAYIGGRVVVTHRY